MGSGETGPRLNGADSRADEGPGLTRLGLITNPDLFLLLLFLHVLFFTSEIKTEPTEDGRFPVSSREKRF